jgi:hypothetical protein
MDMLEAAVVPARERSIEIFGNKKTLDQLRGTPTVPAKSLMLVRGGFGGVGEVG